MIRNLSITTVATCLTWVSLAIFNSYLVKAVTVSRTFTVSDFTRPGIGITDNILFPPGKSYTGVFSYNDELLTGSGSTEISLFHLSFNFLGITYTERDDVGYPRFPKITIQNGNFQGLNFVINKPGLAANFNPSGFFFGLTPLATAGRNETGYSVVDPNGLYFASVSYGSPTVVSVWEPSIIPGIVSVIFTKWLISRKKVKS
ncbi:hypothetical protein [Calothrix sp. 336/3]|uniref:hypothetical protein n=1 Tax=Calothrix sp. 336/3 TaxID=1337936 RepID=UPI00069A6495|nr:hypothetical protein [Calothrix sp. 336/3]